MQLRHLRTFLMVAATLNFTRSAQRLHLSQSSVTEQIQALESDLGAPLFERSSRKLALTAAGNRLVDYARKILALSDEAHSAVLETTNTAKGQLSIGGLATLCSERLPNVVARYRARCPDVQVTLRTGNSRELRDLVKSGDLDVSFAFGSAPDGSQLLSERIAEEELVIIAAPGHRIAKRKRVTLNDLLEEEFAITEKGCVYRKMFEDAFAASRPVRPRVIGEFASMDAIRRLVEQGLGCAFVPRLVAFRALESGTVVKVQAEGCGYSVPVTMYWRGQTSNRPALLLLLDTARETFRLT